MIKHLSSVLPLRTIANGLLCTLSKYKPKDQVKIALTEILGYTREAAEEEEKREGILDTNTVMTLHL
jgi:hypothetical protein